MSKALSRETREVHNLLERAGRGIPAATRRKRAGYMNSGLVVLGLSVPDLRRLVAEPFSFSGEDERAVLKSWDRVFQESPVFEARGLALLFYETRLKKLPPAKYFPVLKKWAQGIENWEHADRLSKIFAEFLERDPERVYPVLEKWNRSNSSWLRRLSVVSLICFANLRETVPPAGRIFPLLERLIDDQDMYVQKGLGWTLRETGRVYPEQTRRFVEQHVGGLAPTAFTIALEKAPKSYRETLKTRRKTLRRQSGEEPAARVQRKKKR